MRIKLTAHLRLISLKISNYSQRKDHTGGSMVNTGLKTQAFKILSGKKKILSEVKLP